MGTLDAINVIILSYHIVYFFQIDVLQILYKNIVNFYGEVIKTITSTTCT